MRRVLEELAAREVPLATLYASTTVLYRRLGFEAAGCRFSAELTPTEIEISDHTLPVRLATPDDREPVQALYRRMAPAHDGHLDRGPYLWYRLIDGFGVQTHGILVDENDALAGYAYYRNHKLLAGNRHRVEITDLCASSGAALRRLWTFFGDLMPMVEGIDFPTAPHDPAFLVHPELRARMQLRENWMVRIVDLRHAFQTRGYAPGVAGTINLEVHDDVLPSNAGRWRVTVEGGHGRLQPGGDGTVRCDARGLAALFTGFCSPATLVACGRMAGPTDALRNAAALTAGALPWMREMF
jgi:predicted acetyltransferase